MLRPAWCLLLLGVLGAATPAGASGILAQSGNDYRVQLTPGDPLEVSFVVTVPTWMLRPVDLFLAVEAGASFVGEKVTVGTMIAALSPQILALAQDTWFGLGSFVDKPVGPFGMATDYEYRTDQPLSADPAAWQNALAGLVNLSGSDAPESQLTALLMIGLRAEIGFRADSLRVAVLATDSPYHEAGDFGSAPANDGDAILDGTPLGSGEDYPSVAQVDQALSAAGVVPVFLSPVAEKPAYDQLATTLGGASIEIAASPSTLLDAIDMLLSDVTSPVDLSVVSGSSSLIQSIGADSVGDLMAGDTRTFDVVLEWDGVSAVDPSLIFGLGFGSATVTVEVPEPGAPLRSAAALLATGWLGRNRFRRGAARG